MVDQGRKLRLFSLTAGALLSGCIEERDYAPDVLCKAPSDAISAIAEAGTAQTRQSSATVDSDDMNAKIWVDGQGDTSQVRVSLTDNICFLFCDSVELTGGDFLSAKVGGGIYTGFRRHDGYRKTLPINADGETYTVTLHRGSASFPDAISDVVMPFKKTFQLPDAEVYGAAEDIPVSWVPSGLGGSFEASARVTCATDGFSEVPDGWTFYDLPAKTVSTALSTTDSGSLLVPADDLLTSWSQGTGEGVDPAIFCRLDLTTVQTNTGTRSLKYGSGFIQATQTSSHSVCIDPAGYMDPNAS